MSRRSDDDLFDEVALRRALRLDASELPPRLQAAAISARASAIPPFGLASLASSLFAGLAAATLLAAGTVTISSLLPSLAGDAFAAALSLVASVAVHLEPAVQAMQQPTIPIAALAAIAFAIAYEYRMRKERANA
jgi:hypothetical protein